MPRSLTIKNLLDKKPGKRLQFASEVLARAIGPATRRGCWIIYGAEKNGKTWMALQIAKELAGSEKVVYISAEEGLEDSFTAALLRAGLTAADRVGLEEYMSVKDIIEKYNKPKAPNVIILDNLTVYADELRPLELKKTFIDALPDKLLILIAHEERREPFPALARMAKKVANVVINIRGLKAIITSRFASGGEIVIDEEKSALFWGEKETV
jgi:hypothetical protein